MNSIDKLRVMYHDQCVGRLSMTPDNRLCTFEYHSQWLVNGFSISPRELPLQKGVFIAQPTPFYGDFGIFEDSLPDGYGRYLLHKILKREGIDDTALTPLDRLSIVGSSGMGALYYVPETLVGKEKSLPSLDRMQQLALDVLSEKHDGDEDLLYFNSGNSGGCRPKCLYHDNEGSWIVKFRHTYDPLNMGQTEFLYNERARECGILVPDFKLINDKYFATKRFDIIDGERVHVATAGALLGESINNPMMDYKTLIHLTGWLTQKPSDVEQMFRLMTFNVLTGNKDDHPKNFSFFYHSGKWHLAPAYDLTRNDVGYNGEHATSVNGNGCPTEEDLLSVGESIRIDCAKGKRIIEHTRSVCHDILVN